MRLLQILKTSNKNIYMEIILEKYIKLSKQSNSNTNIQREAKKRPLTLRELRGGLLELPTSRTTILCG